MEGILAISYFVLLVLDIVTVFAAYVYSRFVFSGYLKKRHRTKWKELVLTDHLFGLNFFAFDKSPEMYDFRVKSNDNLGDLRVQQIRRISIILFRVGMFGWLGLLLAFIVVAVWRCY